MEKVPLDTDWICITAEMFLHQWHPLITRNRLNKPNKIILFLLGSGILPFIQPLNLLQCLF